MTYNQKDIDDFVGEIILCDYDCVKERRISYLTDRKKTAETMEIITMLIGKDASGYRKKIYRLNKEIMSYEKPEAIDYTKKEEEHISEQDIEKARAYPVDSLIEFKNGSAKCFWHSEKTPSLKYWKKENKAHCFGCDKTVDSIEAVRFLYNYSFVEAVKYLKNL